MSSSKVITYSRIVLGKGIQHQFVRPLEQDSQIFVKVNEMVRPETIISSVWRKSGYRTFNLAKMLNTTPEKAENLLERTIGSRVYQGDVIARKKEMMGLREKLFRSPLSGVLVDYDKNTARLTIQYLPTEEKMVSGVFGRISDIVPGKEVKVETHANLIFGAITFGVGREGGLMEVGYPDIPLQADQLSEKCSGKILFGGTKASLDILYKALSLGAKAIITGGIDYQDYLRLRGSRGRLEDIGLSVLVTEGIGGGEIYQPIYQLLKESEHRHVFFSSGDGSLVIPLPSDANKVFDDKSRSIGYGQIRKFTVLKKGDVVRIVVGEEVNEYGRVESTDEDGLVLVEVNSRKLKYKPTQLEIIQFI